MSGPVAAPPMKRDVPFWISPAVIAGVFVTMLLAEARPPLRAQVEPKLRHTIRNRSTGGISLSAYLPARARQGLDGRILTLHRLFSAISAASVCLLVACGGENTPSNVRAAGAPKDAQTKTLEAGAAMLRDKTPVSKINVYLDGFHFRSGDLHHQMEAHHYCAKVNEDLTQCALFDGNADNARLIGIEYIVSGKLFNSLPPDEKKLWHSHGFEVKSGQLVGPGLPDVAEHAFMEKMMGTYGKTWHTWDTSNPANTLPVGIPQLMMGFTADGQIDPALPADRDKRFSISTAQKKQNRANIADVPIDPMADTGLRPDAPQLQVGSGTPGASAHQPGHR